MKIEGFHGRSDPAHPTEVRDLYVAPKTEQGRQHAEDYAEPHPGETDGGLFHVSYTAKNPLVISRPEHFVQAWKDSRASEANSLSFHPHTTSRFTNWAREQGHDAVHLPQELFDAADSSENTEHWETVRGTFGEPQSIILNPKQANVERIR